MKRLKALEKMATGAETLSRATTPRSGSRRSNGWFHWTVGDENYQFNRHGARWRGGKGVLDTRKAGWRNGQSSEMFRLSL
ncbi:MAG: hypothetical protein WBS33_05890 [Verrucomicrobiia bacterium]